MNHRSILRTALPALLLLSTAGCEVGPDYQKPSAPIAATYKEQADWKPAEPQDVPSRGDWWSIYHDDTLDGLEKRVDISNQTLKESEAAYRVARAAVDAARAGYLPTITGSASGTRSYSGGGSSRAGTGTVTTGTGTTGTGTTVSTSTGGGAYNTYAASLGASWEPDIWGKISRTVEGDLALAQVSAADLESARLSAQATLAMDYFELRYQDELARLLQRTVTEYQKSFTITQNQYKVGVAAKADVLTAQTTLQNAQASLINAGVTRATLEHAIAVLVGTTPDQLALPAGPLTTNVPVVPTGLPSELLERRPDIAGAERQMAAESAQIGVAIAAYYPTISLSASDGYSGLNLAHLISSPNNVWSLGLSAAQTLFDGGLRSAQVEQARATYDQYVATYRQTVLAAFQQVEDELATLRILARQTEVENEVVKSAEEATRLTLNQYKAGTVPYSSVVTAQATELSTKETAINVIETRLVASVTLIEAVGGGWTAGKLPHDDQIEDNSAFLHVIPITTEHPTSSDGSTPTQ
jgi:NodT family efflux transporter outer membrane factor (OMF) lipoprotein